MPARRNSLMAQKQNFSLAKIPPPSPSSEKIPAEAPSALAIRAELFILDHHPIVHVKYKTEKMPQIGKWGCGPRWRLNMHKFGCWVNRWKLEWKFEKKNHIHPPDHSQAEEAGLSLSRQGLDSPACGMGWKSESVQW